MHPFAFPLGCKLKYHTPIISTLIACSHSFKIHTQLSLWWYHCVVARLIEILFNVLYTADDFAETSWGNFYLPLNIPFKDLNTAHNPNGFAYNNREPYTWSRTFTYAGNCLDSRNITGIGMCCQDHNVMFEVHIKY